MTSRAILTQRDGKRRSEADIAAEAEGLGVSVLEQVAGGMIVEGDNERLQSLEHAGMRVKLLRDTNLLRIGDHEIDTEAAGPDSAPQADNGRAWSHHLVQCIAPPTEAWIDAIEEKGVEVVEPISAYGLFVVGEPDRVANLTEMSFVAWTGPFLPEYRIDPSARGHGGSVDLAVTVYPASDVATVRDMLASAGGTPRVEEQPAGYGGTFAVVEAKVPASTVPELAAQPSVRWVELRPPLEPLGEREAQILAENLDATGPPDTAPVTGYAAFLTGVGLTGQGTTVAIVDTGVDANAGNNATGHTDLRGRQTAFVDYTAGSVPTDTNGHGTHVAGIAVGSAATGQTEAAAPANFLWGQGMAPQAGYVTQNFLSANPQPTVTTLIEDAAANGADVMNNSWGSNDTPGTGYGSQAREIDLGVRDANGAATGIRSLVIVCAAGNDGGSDSSISRPHESKNDIVVGNSLTRRPNNGFPGDDIRGISGSSSRGPAVDDRILPTIVAPGTDVSSAFSRTSTLTPIPGTGTPDPGNPAVLIDQYLSLSGTSMAAPAVSGACALIVDWWRHTRGQDPSPALVKALLINSAEDLAGGQNWRSLNRTSVDKATWSLQSGSIFQRTLAYTPDTLLEGPSGISISQVGSLAAITAPGQWFFDPGTSRLFVRTTGSVNPGAANVPRLTARDTAGLPSLPNGHQGWGRVSLENLLLQAPVSDRGPRIVSDESHAFTTNGQEHMVRVSPVDAARPMRITLTWSDAAGAAGSNPALVNDLDLEVTETATGDVLKGNVFANGFSTTGGAFNDRDTVECVYVENPSGTYEVRVIAASITAPARPDQMTAWQDFALVMDNAEVPDPGPVSVVPVLDRSGSMVAYGYVDVTRTASRQFVGLMGLDDELGIVSFGDDGADVFPTGPPGLATITGQSVRDAGQAAIDGIAFGGCTFMGDGITHGRDLLAGATHDRAIVLFSDGYDNRGCDPGDPAKPSAQQAAATLPADVALHSCAMGPASDQALLSSLASNGGRYYYMPTIDDLFEIYNYVRGQVSGDAVSVIASAQASSSQVAVMVDAPAEMATFTVAWSDPRFRYVARGPRKRGEVGIRLRRPDGGLLAVNDSNVHRVAGAGYVVFKLHDPAPGRWQVQVSTVGDAHLRYTVGGFCSSPLRLAVEAPSKLAAGEPAKLTATMRSGKRAIPVRMRASVIAPTASLDKVLEKHRKALDRVKPPRSLGPDSLPDPVARMVTLRADRLAAGEPDPFGTTVTTVALRPIGRDGAMTAGFDTPEAGSYNVVVHTTGIDPDSQSRFSRQELVSVLVS